MCVPEGNAKSKHAQKWLNIYELISLNSLESLFIHKYRHEYEYSVLFIYINRLHMHAGKIYI